MPQYNTSSTAKKAPLNHELYMSVLMTPDMANFIGNVPVSYTHLTLPTSDLV